MIAQILSFNASFLLSSKFNSLIFFIDNQSLLRFCIVIIPVQTQQKAPNTRTLSVQVLGTFLAVIAR